jgi:hypothetical protein
MVLFGYMYKQIEGTMPNFGQAASFDHLAAEIKPTNPMSEEQLLGAVENLRKLEARAVVGSKVAVADVGPKPRKDVEYWRAKLNDDLSPRAAVDSANRPLVVRE